MGYSGRPSAAAEPIVRAVRKGAPELAMGSVEQGISFS